jgi:RNA polymerase sigma-70 factor (ECF subfamily)
MRPHRQEGLSVPEAIIEYGSNGLSASMTADVAVTVAVRRPRPQPQPDRRDAGRHGRCHHDNVPVLHRLTVNRHSRTPARVPQASSTTQRSSLDGVHGALEDDLTALALAAGRGDQRAFEQWVRALQADVWRFHAYRAGPGAADDLTQETFVRAYRSLPRFAARSSSRSWLLSIARRVIVDSIRSAVARPQIQAGGDWETMAEQRCATPRSERTFEDVVETRILLADLEPERREALMLTQVLGLSYQEAADVCGVPVGTIRSRVARARETLLAAVNEAHTDEVG